MFPFVQLEVPGQLGLADGRYLVRARPGIAEHVLVMRTMNAPKPAGRRARRARAVAEAELPLVPVTRVSAVRAEALEGDPQAWLERVSSDEEALEETVRGALAAVNAALHAHGIATQDPHARALGADAALRARIGYGEGDQVADGRWAAAVEVTVGAPRRRRAEALRPQERVAAVLAGREELDACETLLLRARADLDAGRLREGAVQLRAGVDALLAELPGRAGPDQEDDLAALQDDRPVVSAAAEDALRGPLLPDAGEHLEAALAIAERILRRRRILGSGA
jgi:hypothetical protein